MLETSSMPMVQPFLEQVLWDIPDQQVPDTQDQLVVQDRLVLQVILVVPELQAQLDIQVAQVLWQDIPVQLELQARRGTVEVLAQLP
jgi:hypothetical protein